MDRGQIRWFGGDYPQIDPRSTRGRSEDLRIWPGSVWIWPGRSGSGRVGRDLAGVGLDLTGVGLDLTLRIWPGSILGGYP